MKPEADSKWYPDEGEGQPFCYLFWRQGHFMSRCKDYTRLYGVFDAQCGFCVEIKHTMLECSKTYKALDWFHVPLTGVHLTDGRPVQLSVLSMFLGKPIYEWSDPEDPLAENGYLMVPATHGDAHGGSGGGAFASSLMEVPSEENMSRGRRTGSLFSLLSRPASASEKSIGDCD